MVNKSTVSKGESGETEDDSEMKQDDDVIVLDDENEEEKGDGEQKEEGEEADSSLNSESQNSVIEEGEKSISGGENNENEFETPQPKKKRTIQRDKSLGTSLIEIPGTPILRNVTDVDRVPTSEKFAVDICDHKPFEMEANTPSGSYQKIVDLTRKFKSNPVPPSS